MEIEGDRARFPGNQIFGFVPSTVAPGRRQAAYCSAIASDVGRCGIRVYRTTNVGSLTPHDSATDTADPAALDLDVPAGGIVIAQGTSNTDINPVWTGVTGDTNTNQEGRTLVSGSAAFAAAQTPLDCELAWDAASAEPGAIAVALAGTIGDAGFIARVMHHRRMMGMS